MTDAHTTYRQASAGNEREFERTLVQEITLAIAHAPTCSDAAAMAFSTAETASALLTALVGTLATVGASWSEDRRRMLGSVMKEERRT